MKKIFLIGAGRSTSALIQYLLKNAAEQDWQITIGDRDLELAQSKVGTSARAQAIHFDVNNEMQRLNEISKADLVISMLPARMHLSVAKECVGLGKHMVTASYISDEMRALQEDAEKAGVVMMNEIGLDPGIDHMSAMKVLDEIKEAGGEMLQFESFAGGLVAPESDDNPWNYKFTWNPRNVVLAGSSGAVKFKQEGRYKYIPYSKVFRRTEFIEIDSYGTFEGYANRDSLTYREVYGLNDVPTIYRGTLRRPGFCKAWDVFVHIGVTDDTYILEGTEDMTYRQFMNSFLAYNPSDSVELKLMHYMRLEQGSEVMEKLKWLGVFEDTKIGLKDVTPAQVLQHILEKKWTMSPDDKDMIVMYHKFGYRLNGESKQRVSSMVVKGDDSIYTAMAKTVGLPVGIATKMILNGTISSPGVMMPISKEIYGPVLEELESYGIAFQEKETAYQGY